MLVHVLIGCIVASEGTQWWSERESCWHVRCYDRLGRAQTASAVRSLQPSACTRHTAAPDAATASSTSWVGSLPELHTTPNFDQGSSFELFLQSRTPLTFCEWCSVSRACALFAHARSFCCSLSLQPRQVVVDGGQAEWHCTERKASMTSIQRLVLLTTRTADWFEQRGFKAAGPAHESLLLPESRREQVNSTACCCQVECNQRQSIAP